MSREQITDYVICPIKIAKSTKSEIERVYNDTQVEYTQGYIKKWYEGRTNQPYKNILKNEDYNKKFKNKEDLIVHKITDEDKIGLLDEYEKLVHLLETHNKELKVVYSTSNKTKHKE